jgi:hypothetical protein
MDQFDPGDPGELAGEHALARAAWAQHQYSLHSGNLFVCLVGDHEVPAVEAVLAAVLEHVARLGVVGHRQAEEMAAASAVDAVDDLVNLHGLG